MPVDSVLPILQAGFSGLAFLLAYLSFLLLKAEQRQTNPRQQILRAIDKFAVFALLLGIFSLSSFSLDAWFRQKEFQANLAISTADANAKTTDAKLKESEALRGQIASLKSQVSLLERSTAKNVFAGVCSQDRWNCKDRTTADSARTSWRSMTPSEVHICTLACR